MTILNNANYDIPQQHARPFSLIDPDELRSLIEGVQRNDAAAVEKLCRCFDPLVRAAARKAVVYNALKEDAVSIAWIVFLEFCKGYRGSNYACLPGLLKKVLHLRLLNAAKRKGQQDSRQILSEDALLQLQTPDCADAIIDSLTLSAALQTLSPAQREFVRLKYVEKKSIGEMVALLQLSRISIYKKNKRILQKLRSHYL